MFVKTVVSQFSHSRSVLDLYIFFFSLAGALFSIMSDGLKTQSRGGEQINFLYFKCIQFCDIDIRQDELMLLSNKYFSHNASGYSVLLFLERKTSNISAVQNVMCFALWRHYFSFSTQIAKET